MTERVPEERNLEHERAKYAYACIDQICGESKEKQKDYQLGE